jgi:ATP-dependent RNA circularization protein (DNA/RNA ligase family)
MTKFWKYPRTLHFPFSPGKGRNDRISRNFSFLEGKNIVITEKMDGENITIYSNNVFHARSPDNNSFRTSPFHSWLVDYISEFSFSIPQNVRICGEYLYHAHSIRYENLPSYFLVFSVWKNETCFSWDETLEFCEKYSLFTVPVLYEGKFDLEFLQRNCEKISRGEGFVVRLRDSFTYSNFSNCVFKYVRKNHVTSEEHWKKIALKHNIRNSLKK